MALVAGQAVGVGDPWRGWRGSGCAGAVRAPAGRRAPADTPSARCRRVRCSRPSRVLPDCCSAAAPARTTGRGAVYCWRGLRLSGRVCGRLRLRSIRARRRAPVGDPVGAAQRGPGCHPAHGGHADGAQSTGGCAVQRGHPARRAPSGVPRPPCGSAAHGCRRRARLESRPPGRTGLSDFAAPLREMLTAAGSTAPERHTLALLAWCDGILFPCTAGTFHPAVPTREELRTSVREILSGMPGPAGIPSRPVSTAPRMMGMTADDGHEGQRATASRDIPGGTGTERELLEGWLDFHRADPRWQVRGPDRRRQLAGASAPPSELTLLGLVRHLAEVERSWFRRVLDERGRRAALLHDGGRRTATFAARPRATPAPRRRSPSGSRRSPRRAKSTRPASPGATLGTPSPARGDGHLAALDLHST